MWLIVSPSFAKLQNGPQSIWLTGHIAVQDLPPVVADDEEAVQNPEVSQLRRSVEPLHHPPWTQNADVPFLE